jgi:hypothetical protein
MALYRLAVLAGIALALGGCDTQKTQGQVGPRPVVEVTPDTKAVADVDQRATLAFKQALLTNFPEGTPIPDVEAGLARDGFTCGSNPVAQSERACLQTKREGGCEINTIVRSAPYAPDKSQVIKVCEVGTQAQDPH